MKPTSVYWRNLDAFLEGYRVIANKGSSRSSKTFSVMQLLDTICRTSKEHLKCSVVSSTFPRVKSGPIYEYEKFLQSEGINVKKIQNKADHQFHVGRSVIEYFGVDQTEKVIGPGRDILYINEANVDVAFETYHQLRQRTTGTIFIDYNPSGKYWLHTEGIVDDPRTKLIHSTFKDNIENLTDQQIHDFVDAYKLAKNSDYWRYWVKVYAEGEDGVLLEERVMPFFKIVKGIPEDAVQIPTSLDFGFNPDPTASAQLYVKKNDLKDDLYIREIIYDTKLSINTKSDGQVNLVDLLEQKGHNKNHLIISESSEPRNIVELRNAGFNIEAVKKQSVESSIRLFHDYNIYITEDSPNVQYEFENLKYAKDRKTNEITGVVAKDQADHHIDGIRYILMSRNNRWSV